MQSLVSRLHFWKYLAVLVVLGIIFHVTNYVWNDETIIKQREIRPRRKYSLNEINPKPPPVNPLQAMVNPDMFCVNDLTSVNQLPQFKGPTSNRPPIFMVETSCRSVTAGKLILLERQACSIESTARTNPNSDLYVLILARTTLNTWEDTMNAKLIREVLTYPNVHIQYLNVLEFVKGTMLDDWYSTGMLMMSKYAESHISDMLRFLILWKHGGMYLDIDVVVMTPIEQLEANFVAYENSDIIGSTIMNFAATGLGHEALEEMIYDFRDNYDGDNWDYNGPGVITRHYAKRCTTSNHSEMQRENCSGLLVYPPDEFYPIGWPEWELFFTPNTSQTVVDKVKKSRMVHLWNYLSGSTKMKRGNGSPYDTLAKTYCPKVYAHFGDYI